MILYPYIFIRSCLLISVPATLQTSILNTNTFTDCVIFVERFQKNIAAFLGGGMWESNPPGTLLTPHTSFED